MIYQTIFISEQVLNKKFIFGEKNVAELRSKCMVSLLFIQYILKILLIGKKREREREPLCAWKSCKRCLAKDQACWLILIIPGLFSNVSLSTWSNALINLAKRLFKKRKRDGWNLLSGNLIWDFTINDQEKNRK